MHSHSNGMVQAQRGRPKSNHIRLSQTPRVMIPAPLPVAAIQRPSQFPPMGLFNIPPRYDRCIPPGQQEPYFPSSQGKVQSLSTSNGLSVPIPIASSSPSCAESPSFQQSISAPSPFPDGQLSSPTHTPPISTPHNPFLNHFSRQPPGSAQSIQSFASPTPSLSATQGNTDVQFSMTRHGSDPSCHAYTPVMNQSAAGAVSPTKTASSPAQPSGLSPYVRVTAAAESLHALAAAPGVSPAKHGGPCPSSASGSGIPFNGPSTLTLPSIIGQASPLMNILSPTISLSPSVNVGEQNLEPPTKKVMPEVHATSHTNGYKASSVY